MTKCQRVEIKKKVLTRLGRVELPKTHPLCPKRNNFKITAKLQEEICFLGQMSVYREASDLFEKMFDLHISDQQVRRVCNYYGEYVDKVIKANIEPMIPQIKETNRQDPTYVMMDGSMLFTRIGEWKELKLARVFKGSKVIDIQKNRSEIVDTVYCSHLGSVNEFFPKLERHLVKYQHLVVVADGAPWIWTWCEDNYPGCIQILDYFHAKEKLVLLANAHFKDPEKKKWWLDNQLEMLKDDGVQQVIKNVSKLPCRIKPAKEAKEKLLKYYNDHEDRMTYKTFMNKGYLIGSGPIEAAHRSVIQQRMKLSGQKWSIDGANAIANLRCYRKSGAWDKIRTLIRANAA
jgi:hypothetical protein